MEKISETVQKMYANFGTEKMRCVVKVQSEIRRAMGDFLRSKDFVEIPPVIISPITDPLHHATGKAVVEHYSQVYQLTRSMLFHKQISLLTADKVFAFSPNIRLEPIELSDGGKHLIEFTQLDLEVKLATRDDVIELGEDLLTFVLEYVKNTCKNELKFFNRDLRIPTKPFQRIEYAEAYNKYAGNFESILSHEHKEPFWIIDVPLEAREFYDRENPNKEGFLNDMDLIYPEGYGEALSGGEREYLYERVIYRIGRSGLSLKDFEWYTEFVKQGLFPSAGFGIGIERLTRFVCGLKRIEEATLFPKVPGKVSL